MPSQLNSGELIANISSELADNNAGLISAYDVRHNMEDIAFSINKIVSSGDSEVKFPFFNAVKFSIADSTSPNTDADHGDLIVESGIFFPNADDASKQTKRQTEPWLGDTGINHDNLYNLSNDTHLQYYNRDGSRPLTGNMSTNNGATENWINCSGIDNVGLKFVQKSADAVEQEIHVSGDIKFINDNSWIRDSAKGVAKAWCNFDASGIYDGVDNVAVPRSWYNIEQIERLGQGKIKITFASGVFDNNNYVAIGTANATNSAGSIEDFSVNSVGLVLREGNNGPDDTTTKRTITYAIKNENGDFVDSQYCDFVAWGYTENETSGTVPTIVGI